MGLFSRLMVMGTGAAMLLIPLLATSRGWGFGTERNAEIIDDSDDYCPQVGAATTNCPKNHRSYYHGRERLGGSYGHGK